MIYRIDLLVQKLLKVGVSVELIGEVLVKLAEMKNQDDLQKLLEEIAKQMNLPLDVKNIGIEYMVASWLNEVARDFNRKYKISWIRNCNLIAEIYVELEERYIKSISVDYPDSIILDERGICLPKLGEDFYYWEPYAFAEGQKTQLTITVNEIPVEKKFYSQFLIIETKEANHG